MEEFGKYHRLHRDDIWLYLLRDHKTQESIGDKPVPLCLEAQEILEKYLDGKPGEAYVFTKTSKRGFGKPFTVAEYGRHLKRRIDKYGLEKFVSYQLRHFGVTQASTNFGLDTARAMVGHTSVQMTKRYDHSDLEKAIKVVEARNQKYLERKKAVGHDCGQSENLPVLTVFTGE